MLLISNALLVDYDIDYDFDYFTNDNQVNLGN
jgi:hypothetical protein